MKPTNIYLTERQKEWLRAWSEKEGLPVAELIRRAVDAYLAWIDPSYAPTPITPHKERRSHPPLE